MFKENEMYKHETMVDVAMFITHVESDEHGNFNVSCEWYNTTYKMFIGISGKYQISFEKAKEYKKIEFN